MSAYSTILQVVPRLAPGVDGVGDYSLLLAGRLRQSAGVDTIFVSCDSSQSSPENLYGFRVVSLGRRHATHLYRSLVEIQETSSSSINTLILQCVPYGYQPRGCPIWLAQGLTHWARHSENRLLTMFHELDADETSPWNSAFWLQSAQRMILKKIASISRASFTNTLKYQDKLARWGAEKPLLSTTFSNVGEPIENGPWEQRKQRLVIFGRPWQRERTYTLAAEQLERTCRDLAVTSIVDIGSPMERFAGSTFRGIPVNKLGQLPATRISEELMSSVAAFVFYPEDRLTKSGVFAACCSHGVIPVIVHDGIKTLATSDLMRGVDFFHVEDLPSLDLTKASDIVFQQYQTRSSTVAAQFFADQIADRS
jgi:hypothetical protein